MVKKKTDQAELEEAAAELVLGLVEPESLELELVELLDSPPELEELPDFELEPEEALDELRESVR